MHTPDGRIYGELLNNWSVAGHGREAYGKVRYKSVYDNYLEMPSKRARDTSFTALLAGWNPDRWTWLSRAKVKSKGRGEIDAKLYPCGNMLSFILRYMIASMTVFLWLAAYFLSSNTIPKQDGTPNPVEPPRYSLSCTQIRLEGILVQHQLRRNFRPWKLTKESTKDDTQRMGGSTKCSNWLLNFSFCYQTIKGSAILHSPSGLASRPCQ